MGEEYRVTSPKGISINGNFYKPGQALPCGDKVSEEACENLEKAGKAKKTTRDQTPPSGGLGNVAGQVWRIFGAPTPGTAQPSQEETPKEDPVAKAAREAREKFDRGVQLRRAQTTPPAAGTPEAPTTQQAPASQAAPKEPSVAPAKPRAQAPKEPTVFAKVIAGIDLLTRKEIKVKVGDDTISSGVKIPWSASSKIRRIHKSEQAELSTTLDALNRALDPKRPSKYNINKVLELLRMGSLTLEQIGLLKGRSGDELIEALLEVLFQKPLEYEKGFDNIAAKRKDVEELLKNGKYKEALGILQAILKFETEKELNTSRTNDAINLCRSEIAKRELAIDNERKQIAEYAAHLRYVVFEIPSDKLSAVAQYISQTAPKQRLITFNADGRTYSALIEEKDGKWQLVTPTHKKYSLKIENNNPVVYQKTGIFGSDRLATTQVPLPAVQPEGGGGREEAYLVLYRITRGSLLRADFDKIWKNGKIDQQAAKDILGWKEKLYLLVANNMNADKTTDSGINLAKLKEFENVIKYWMSELGMKQEEVAQLFIESKEFCMVDYNEVKQTGAALRNQLSGVTKENIGERLNGYSPKVIAEILLRFENKPEGKEKLIAAYLLRFLMASITQRYEAFGVAQSKSVIAQMPAYHSTSFNKNRVAAWFSGRTVATTEQPPARFASAGEGKTYTEEDFQDDSEFEKIYSYSTSQSGPAAQRSAAANYMKTLRDSGQLAKLIGYFRLATKNDPSNSYYIPGLESDISSPAYASGAINIMFAAYIATRDPGSYDRAFEILKKLPDSENKYHLLAQLAIKYFEVKTSGEDRKRALEVLREIKENNFFVKEGASYLQELQKLGLKVVGDNTRDNIINSIEKSFKAPTEAWWIEREFVTVGRTSDTDRTEAINWKQGGENIPKAVSAVAKLDAIISDKNTSPYEKAYAQYVKGMLLYLIAKSHSDMQEIAFGDKKVKAKDLLDEAMYTLRTAWETIKDSKEPHAREQRKDVFARMVTIVERVKHTMKGEESGRKKRARELAEFIPQYKTGYGEDMDAEYQYRDAVIKRGDPEKYRKSVGAKADRYTKYKSVFSSEPEKPKTPKPKGKLGAAARPAAAPKPGDKGKKGEPADPNAELKKKILAKQGK